MNYETLPMHAEKIHSNIGAANLYNNGANKVNIKKEIDYTQIRK